MNNEHFLELSRELNVIADPLGLGLGATVKENEFVDFIVYRRKEKLFVGSFEASKDFLQKYRLPKPISKIRIRRIADGLRDYVFAEMNGRSFDDARDAILERIREKLVP